MVVRKAVFLDRDGTIIDNQGDLGDPMGVTIISGVAEAITSIADAGWLIIVVTNQGVFLLKKTSKRCTST